MITKYLVSSSHHDETLHYLNIVGREIQVQEEEEDPNQQVDEFSVIVIIFIQVKFKIWFSVFVLLQVTSRFFLPVAR